MAGQDKDLPDEEPAENDSHSVAVVPQESKRRRSFTNVRRELSEKELGSPAVQKLILDEMDRLDNDLREAKVYIEKYHTVDKEAAMLKQKLRPQTSLDIMQGSFIATGSLMVGFCPNAWNYDIRVGIFLLVVGVMLILAGVAAKVVAKL